MLAFGLIHLLKLLVEQIFDSAVFAENVAGCSVSLQASAAGGADELEKGRHGIYYIVTF